MRHHNEPVARFGVNEPSVGTGHFLRTRRQTPGGLARFRRHVHNWTQRFLPAPSHCKRTTPICVEPGQFLSPAGSSKSSAVSPPDRPAIPAASPPRCPSGPASARPGQFRSAFVVPSDFFGREFSCRGQSPGMTARLSERVWFVDDFPLFELGLADRLQRGLRDTEWLRFVHGTSHGDTKYETQSRRQHDDHRADTWPLRAGHDVNRVDITFSPSPIAFLALFTHLALPPRVTPLCIWTGPRPRHGFHRCRGRRRGEVPTRGLRDAAQNQQRRRVRRRTLTRIAGARLWAGGRLRESAAETRVIHVALPVGILRYQPLHRHKEDVPARRRDHRVHVGRFGRAAGDQRHPAFIPTRFDMPFINVCQTIDRRVRAARARENDPRAILADGPTCQLMLVVDVPARVAAGPCVRTPQILIRRRCRSRQRPLHPATHD